MKRWTVLALVAAVQLVLVGAAVAPQLSARTTGEVHLLRVAPLDPIDPFRGAYSALTYPDLQTPQSDEEFPDSIGRVEDDERGDLFIVLRRDGEVWVADEFTRERPDGGTYLACTDRSWQTRCGIESLFASEASALETDALLGDGAVAEVRIDRWGNAAVVGIRAEP